MANKIKPKRSYTSNSVPLATDLETNELAINWADGKAYTKNASGQIVSVTLGGSGGSSSSEDTALRAFFVPPAPTNVTATAGNAQATVSWTAPTVLAQTPITDYVVQYSSNSGSTWTTFSDGTSTSTSATVTGLTNGTAYTFRVAGVNGVGTGAYSAASSAVTPVAVFSPDNITGIKAWYDAADSATLFNATSGGSAVAADGAVARWEDKSGNGYHFTSSSGPTRKTAIHSGKDTVRFADKYMTGFTPSSVFSGATAATVFAVMRVDTASGVLFDKIGSAGDNWTPFVGNGKVYDDFASTVRRDTGWVMPLSTLHIISFESSSSDWRLLVNGTQQYAAGSNTVAFGSSAVLLGRNGGEYGGNAVSQDICEIILYSSVLSAGDRASVVNYLKAKWGIA